MTRVQISSSRCLRLELSFAVCNYTSKHCWIIVLFLCVSDRSSGAHCGTWWRRLRSLQRTGPAFAGGEQTEAGEVYLGTAQNVNIIYNIKGENSVLCVRDNGCRIVISLTHSNWLRKSMQISVSSRCAEIFSWHFKYRAGVDHILIISKLNDQLFSRRETTFHWQSTSIN